MTKTHARITAAILFVGLFGCYISLSSGSIAGQGYAGEEIDSGLSMLSRATAWIKGQPIPPMVWSRHGPVPVLFDLPFLRLGKLIVSPDFMLSFSPALWTAGLLAILFLWLRKLCSPGMSLFLTLTAAFGTMLWPYAYIGLETKQSFFVLLAGYLALADGKKRTWPRLLLFAAACALAISVKATGITIGPVIAYLVFVQFRSDWRTQAPRILTVLLIVVALWAFGRWGTNAYGGPLGGGGSNLRPWLIDSPIQAFTNVIGVFGSPTKGLLVYCPVLIASIYAIPRAFRANRGLVIYALLVTTCTLGMLSLLKYPTDEVWGCRYLHLAIAPLILCIGAAWPQFRWRREGGALLVLAVMGLFISFLGAFYYYGVRDFAMTSAGQNTLEQIEGDSDWNHIVFNAQLFQVWLTNTTGAPVVWTPKHIWVWAPPADAPPPKSVNLTDFSPPQSFMVRFWHVPKSGVVSRIFVNYVFWLALGTVLLNWVVLRTGLGTKNRAIPRIQPGCQGNSRNLNPQKSFPKGCSEPMDAKLLADPTWIKARIAEEPYWFHRIELSGGVVTPGWSDPKVEKLPFYGLPSDMTGMRALDIGNAEGFFSFEAERRGAAEVIGIENYPPMARKFEICRAALGSRARTYMASVYDLNPASFGTFDLVMFFGVLYHLRHPILALQKIASVCTGTVLMQTATCENATDKPMAEFHPFGVKSGPPENPSHDPTCFWFPDCACCIAMLQHVGFQDVKQISKDAPVGGVFKARSAMQVKGAPPDEMKAPWS